MPKAISLQHQLLASMPEGYLDPALLVGEDARGLLHEKVQATLDGREVALREVNAFLAVQTVLDGVIDHKLASIFLAEPQSLGNVLNGRFHLVIGEWLRTQLDLE